MTYQINGGFAKDIQVGDGLYIAPGFLPTEISTRDMLLVTNVADPSVVACNMLWSTGGSQIINLDPSLITSVWRKQ